jgi:dolichol-phosphate mannosyltransferase
MKLVVVIPTYNESGTITDTLNKLLAVNDRYGALVVDDNSPDGTSDCVRGHAAFGDRVRMLRRVNERGFGTAVRDGFVEALRLGVPYIGQMDADGSHDPAMFPIMLKRIESDCDAVIGSRYLSESHIHGWSPLRYLNSHVANWLARFSTGLSVADATNGLRAFRRDVLAALPLDRLLSKGYSAILETNYYAQRAGFCLKEIPITFHPRKTGTSKMGPREVYRYIMFLLALRRNALHLPLQVRREIRADNIAA